MIHADININSRTPFIFMNNNISILIEHKNMPKMRNFHPLEGVGRCSETHLQVGENLNYLMQRLNDKPLYCRYIYTLFSIEF